MYSFSYCMVINMLVALYNTEPIVSVHKIKSVLVFLRFCVICILVFLAFGMLVAKIRSLGVSSLRKSRTWRDFSVSAATYQGKKGIILGVYSEDKPESTLEGTKTFQRYDSFLQGKLTSLLSLAKPLKPGNARVFLGTEKCPIVSVVSLGEKVPQPNYECINTSKENIRKAIAAGIDSLKGLGIESVDVDVSGDPIAAAEGAFLSSWKYKESERDEFPKLLEPAHRIPNDAAPINDSFQGWEEGKIFAEGQNFARYLMDSPANLMNPAIFCNTVKEKLESSDTNVTVQVTVRDKAWIEEQKMGAFLSVAKGSDQPPKFLEIHYTGRESSSSSNPLVLVGKGITFDCGGVSIKTSKGMEEMRADMGGAATVSSAVLTAAKLNFSGKVIGLIPLCENMVNGQANKPGDVVTAKDGTTIQVDNTDAEGRLILADALCYAKEFQPAAIVDLATLTGAIIAALGAGAAGVFSNNDDVWNKLEAAGQFTGDRVWRMPIYQMYTDQIKPSYLADINNVGKDGSLAGSCTAASFLHHFVQKGTPWAHLDIAGVMVNENRIPYLGAGMGGRPTRTLAEFIRRFNS